jgi:hypothetical protein
VHILWLLECMVKLLVYKVSSISFATLGTNKVLSLAVFDHIEPLIQIEGSHSIQYS